MRAILSKALADLRSYRLQSAIIFVIVLAASATLTLALTTWRNATDAWDRTFDEANGSHVVFAADWGADLTGLAAVDGVAEAGDPYPTFWDGALVLDGQKHALALAGMTADPPRVDRPVVVEGRWLTADDARGLVLDRSFARDVGIEVGDRVSLPTTSGLQEFTVVGRAVSTSRGPYPDWSPSFAWLLADTLAVVQPDTARWTERVAVRVSDPDGVDAAINRVYAAVPAVAEHGTDTWVEVRGDTNVWNQIAAVFFGIFSIFALVAVAFIIANTIAGRVLAQFREIGLLKAVGFTPRQVSLVFLVQNLLLALAAGVLGIVAGVLIAPLPLRRTADLLNASSAPAFDPLLAVAVLLGVVVLVTLFTLMPAWRGGRVSVVKAISTGFDPVQAKPSLPARLAARLRLPLVVTMGVKDCFARPGRAVLTIVALTMTVTMVTFALGMNAVAQRLIDNPALEGEAYDALVTPSLFPDDETRALLAEQPEVTATHARSVVRAQIPGEEETTSFNVRVFGAGYQAFPYVVSEGRMIAGPGEAVAGLGLLQLLDLEIGDDLAVTLSGQPLTLRIVGRVMETEDQGEIAWVDQATVQPIFPDARPDEYALLLAAGTDGEALRARLLDASGYDLDVTVIDTGTPDEATTLRTVIAGLSGVLLLIGLANLLSTTLLNVRERVRDFGIFKSIGMTPRQILVAVISGVSVLALVAVAVGIPLGLWVYRQLFTFFMERELGADPLLYTRPSWWSLALLVPGAIALAALASAIPARHAAQVPTAEVLRYE